MKKRNKKQPSCMLVVEDYTGKVKKMREKLALNQNQFWGRIGVTQSGGSRYEAGRDIATCVNIALDLAYGKEPEVLLCKMRRDSSCKKNARVTVWFPN